MTFTSRIRIYLLLVAVLPPIAILLAIYFQTARQMELADHRRMQNNLVRFDHIRDSFRRGVEQRVLSVAGTPLVARAEALLRSGRSNQIDLGHNPAGLDFLELLDHGYHVLASHHRPGLPGSLIKDDSLRLASMPSGEAFATVEYDADGVHAAWACVIELDDEMFLYAGQYVAHRFTDLVSILIEADVRLLFGDSANLLGTLMEPGQLYSVDDHFRALLDSPPEAPFVLVADFYPRDTAALPHPLLWLIGLVALLSVAAALLLGWYITGRARREIVNLTRATARIADGDFDTVVMAYEEGEFSQLADAFTEMTIRLRNIRKKLGTAEKIAAWQIMGRKIAHEIKNPLTPIAVSTDDLRRSYNEKLEDFPQILNETTAMIKTEVQRLTTLLDQFVSFARMKPAVPVNTSLEQLLGNLSSLHRKEIDSGRLNIVSEITNDVVHLDPDAFEQVLINLVKNSLEAGEQTKVIVSIEESADGLRVVVRDTGPGFSREILQSDLQPYLSTKKDGSGLGLVICQRIVFDHDGTMEIGNSEEGGAEVTIVLPHNDG